METTIMKFNARARKLLDTLGDDPESERIRDAIRRGLTAQEDGSGLLGLALHSAAVVAATDVDAEPEMALAGLGVLAERVENLIAAATVELASVRVARRPVLRTHQPRA